MKKLLSPVASPRLTVNKSPSLPCLACVHCSLVAATKSISSLPATGQAEPPGSCLAWSTCRRMRTRPCAPPSAFASQIPRSPTKPRHRQIECRKGRNRCICNSVTDSVRYRLISSPIVYVHEFRWDQPHGKPVVGKPSMSDKKEVTVEARKPAQFYAGYLMYQVTQALLVFARQVMMPNIGRVSQYDVVLSVRFQRVKSAWTRCRPSPSHSASAAAAKRSSSSTPVADPIRSWGKTWRNAE